MPEARDPDLYVVVGEQKCVFKYGERPNPEPRLIESVISYVQKEDEKGQARLFTQTLRRNRSVSEEAFFSHGQRKISVEKGHGAYGLTGAQGSISPGTNQMTSQQRRKRNARGVRRAETGSFVVETTEQVIEPFQPSQQHRFRHRSKSKSQDDFSLQEALSPKLGKPFFDDLEVIEEGVPATTFQSTKQHQSTLSSKRKGLSIQPLACEKTNDSV